MRFWPHKNRGAENTAALATAAVPVVVILLRKNLIHGRSLKKSCVSLSGDFTDTFYDMHGSETSINKGLAFSTLIKHGVAINRLTSKRSGFDLRNEYGGTLNDICKTLQNASYHCKAVEWLRKMSVDAQRGNAAIAISALFLRVNLFVVTYK